MNSLTSTPLTEGDEFHPLTMRRLFDAPDLPSGTRSRRKFLTLALGAAACTLAAPGIVRAQAGGSIGRDRVWIICSHSGESMNLPFLFRDPVAMKKAWGAWSYFYRDRKDRNQAVWIDRRMLMLLSDIQMAVSQQRGEETAIMMNSGYRTRARNARTEGAAPNSQHCVGRATDFWCKGMAHRQIQFIADHTRGMGGMGRYNSFTHIDTGPARRWTKS